LTERLYYDDARTLNFTASIIERTTYKDRPAVVLDRSYFYPESGGQPPDTGTLNDIRVNDVQVRANDQAVLHVLDGQIAGDQVAGKIDAARRRDLTQHHTAQHILSAALEKAASAITVSVHMSMESMTIDVNRAPLTDAELRRVEALANEIVTADRPVRSWYPDPSEIAGLGLRKLPDVTGKLRVVDVADGFDVTACGGTHVARTGEIGLIKIIRQEKFKGGARVEFKAAGRALADYAEKNNILMSIAADLTTSYSEVHGAMLSLRSHVESLRAKVKFYKDQSLQAEAQTLSDSAEIANNYHIIAKAFDSRGVEGVDDVKFLVAHLIAKPGIIALFGLAGDTTQLIFGRSSDVPLDVVPALRAALQELGTDRGGGRPNLAQGGGVPATVDQVERALTIGKSVLLKE
jgi:alanyl-tRNA synthetase